MRIFTTTIFLILGILCFSKGQAQTVRPQAYYPMTNWDTSPYQSFRYTRANASWDWINFRLLFPNGYDSTAVDGKKYPIIIMLHGAGESGRMLWNNATKTNSPYPVDDPRRDNNDHQLTFGGREHLRAMQNGRFPGFVLFPQNSYGTWVNGKGDVASTFHTDLAKTIELVEHLVKNLKVDPSRIYIHGLSAGGLGTWLAAYKRPDLFAAVLPMSAPGDPAMAEQLANVPLWVFQGELDTNPRPWATLQTVEAIRAAGGNVRYTEYPQTGHNTWNKAYAEKDFFEWMLGRKKDNVTTPNQAPNVNAGNDKTISLPTNTTSFTATASDPDGTIASYLWTKLEGPAATLSGTNTASLSLSGLVQGTYTFQVRVEDDKKAMATDEVVLDVNPADNQSPTVNAGTDKAITLPTNTTSFTATASDPDGTIASYLWEKTEGPEVTMENASTNTLTLSKLVEGSYTFKVTATDNAGAKVSDEVFLVVDPALNQLPVVNAGEDKEITLPTNTTSFTASASDPDGNIDAYLWEKKSGPAATLNGITTAKLSLSGLVEGSYLFSLTVTDDRGATVKDEVALVVKPAVNQLPTVNAGTDKTITLPTNTTSFTATASDPDGTIATYLWEKVSGPEATLANATTSTVTLTNLVEGSYTFRVTVTDNSGAKVSDEVALLVNPAPNKAPTVNAGTDKSITLPTNTASFTATASDPEGKALTYAWEKVSGPAATLSGATTATLSVAGLVEGSYLFKVSVSDPAGATATDEVVLHVNPAANVSPTVNAGTDKTITLPTNTTSFTATASDPDGTIATYLWEKVSGPEATLANAATSTVSLTNLVEGSYTFRVTVTDNSGAKVSDEVALLVNPAPNKAPIVNAGTDKSITLPTNTASFTATASDPEGKALTYAWEKVSGPAATLSGRTTETLSVAGLLEGSYVFKVTVSDPAGATATDEVSLLVNAIPNQAPTVNAGEDKTIILPTKSTSFKASATDPDGTITAYKWEQLSGPRAALSGTTTSTLSVNELSEGSYLFKVTATDNKGATASDEVQLIVKPAPNQHPTVSAGEDLILTLPENEVSLSAFASDPDGAISSYLWEKVSGPAAGSVRDEDTADLLLSKLVEGTYTFRVTVIDNRGATASDEVRIVVKPQINQKPVVEAGENISMTLPSNTATLKATASDPDGTIASYLWEKISGPKANLSNANTAALNVSELEVGSYTFRVTVKDNMGATASDELIVSVFEGTAVGNQTPLANAGADTIVVLPLDFLGIKGAASDNDGTIVSYLWEKISGPDVRLGFTDSTYMELADLEVGDYVFRFTVTDDKGATAWDEMALSVVTEAPPIVSALDPEEIGSISLVAYPNPFDTFINLRIGFPRQEMMVVTVYDGLSKMLYKGTFQTLPGEEVSYRIEAVSGRMQQGIYYIQVQSQDGKFNKMIKVLKK